MVAASPRRQIEIKPPSFRLPIGQIIESVSSAQAGASDGGASDCNHLDRIFTTAGGHSHLFLNSEKFLHCPESSEILRKVSAITAEIFLVSQMLYLCRHAWHQHLHDMWASSVKENRLCCT